MQLPDPSTMGIIPEMSPSKLGLVNNGGASPLVKQIMKKSFGSPNKSPTKKLSVSNISKSPGKSPSKVLGKDSGKDTPFSSKVFKQWRDKFASKDQNGFHCLVCPKSFTLDSSLKRHYKNVHELVCKCCNMQFAEEHLLKIHHCWASSDMFLIIVLLQFAYYSHTISYHVLQTDNYFSRT